MFIFFIEVIAVSILVNIFATIIKLVPRYSLKKYNLIQQLLNTAFLTVILSILLSLHFYPSWIMLFVIILLILWLSVWLTNNLVSGSKASNAEKPKEANNEQPD